MSDVNPITTTNSEPAEAAANGAPPQPLCTACGLPVGRYRGAERRGSVYHNKRRCLHDADREESDTDTLRPDEALRLPRKGLLDALARMVAGEEEAALLAILREDALVRAPGATRRDGHGRCCPG